MKITFRPKPHTKFALKKELINANLMGEHDEQCEADGLKFNFERGPFTVETNDPNGKLDSPRFELEFDDTKKKYKLVVKPLPDEQITVWSVPYGPNDGTG